MVVPVSQLTSPVIAHAYRNNAYTQKAIDYTPTITRLVDADLSSPQARSIQRNYSNDVVVPTNGEIKVNLEGKDYHEFKAKLAVPREDNSSIRYKVFLDDRQIRDISMKPGEEKDLHVDLFGDDAKELKIVATSSSNARANNPGLVEDGEFKTYYNDYFKIDEKQCPWVWSGYQRASYDYAYIGTRDPFCPIYLKANKEVKFPTYSTGPYITAQNPILGKPFPFNGNPIVTSKTNRTMEVYGTGCSSYTLAVRLRYNAKELTLSRQFYDRNGNIFRACGVKAKIFTPIDGSERYKSAKTTEI